jgi:hypothetical protein
VASKRSLASSVPAVVLTCALSVASGCALTIQAPDPERPRNEPPKCDSGKGSVGLDGVMTALFGLGSIAAFADGEEGTGLALAAIGGLFVASAVRGNSAANACRAAYGEYSLAYQQMLRQEPIAQPIDPHPRPRPVVARKKPPRPVAQPVPEVAPPIENLDPAPTVVEQPQIPRPETYGTPRPASKPGEPKKPPPKRHRTDANDEDWSSFWKEAP